VKHYLPLAFVTLALAGCGANRVSVIAPPREVVMPLPVRCDPTLPDKPIYAGSVVDLGADIFVLNQALLIERDQRQAREMQLEAALTGCAGK